MSHHHYSSGSRANEIRHSTSSHQYDPYEERERYEQARRQGSATRSSHVIGTNNGYHSISSSSASRHQDTRRIGGSDYISSSTGLNLSSSSSRSRDPTTTWSSFPSNSQDSVSWKSKGSALPSARQLKGEYSRSYATSAVWSRDDARVSSLREAHTSHGYKNAGVQLAQSTQPVLMMLQQGSAGNLMVTNPYGIQRQANATAGGVPVILGSLPAGLNPNVFDERLVRSGQYNIATTPTATTSGGLLTRSSGRVGVSGIASARDRLRGRSPLTLGSSRRRSPIRLSSRASLPRKRVSDRGDLRRELPPLKRTRDERTGRVQRVALEPPVPRRERSASKPIRTPTATPKVDSSSYKKRSSKKEDDKLNVAKSSKKESSEAPKKKTNEDNSPSKADNDNEVIVIDDTENDAVETAIKEKVESSPDASKSKSNEKLTQSPTKKSTSKSPMKADETEDEKKRKCKFDDIPPSLLVCKLCQKAMKDGTSYENHLNGKAHAQLLKVIQDRFDKRAELLKLESKFAEEEKDIESERLKRAGQGARSTGKGISSCKMCACTYSTNWGNHKMGLGHRILKEYLHPSCRICEREFQNRMDWLNHFFSSGHLRRIAKLKAEGVNVQVYESINQDELFTVSVEMNNDEKPPNLLTVKNLNWRVPSAKQLKEFFADEDIEKVEVSDDVLIVLPPESSSGNVAVGKETVRETLGFACRACRAYFTEKVDIDEHCTSHSHFANYVKYLKGLMIIQVERKEAELALEKAKILEGEKKNAAVQEKKEEERNTSKSFETSLDHNKGAVGEENEKRGDSSDSDVVILDNDVNQEEEMQTEGANAKEEIMQQKILKIQEDNEKMESDETKHENNEEIKSNNLETEVHEQNTNELPEAVETETEKHVKECGKKEEKITTIENTVPTEQDTKTEDTKDKEDGNEDTKEKDTKALKIIVKEKEEKESTDFDANFKERDEEQDSSSTESEEKELDSTESTDEDEIGVKEDDSIEKEKLAEKESDETKSDEEESPPPPSTPKRRGTPPSRGRAIRSRGRATITRSGASTSTGIRSGMNSPNKTPTRGKRGGARGGRST